MPFSPPAIPELLAQSRTIAVVGLSSRPDRPSHEVAQYLQAQGYRIIPVNPTYAGTRILGEHCYPTLTRAAQAEEGIRIDIVDCFRQAAAMPAIAEEAAALHVPCLWMQLGIISPEAAELAQAAGVMVVMDRCLKAEHQRMLAAQRQQ